MLAQRSLVELPPIFMNRNQARQAHPQGSPNCTAPNSSPWTPPCFTPPHLLPRTSRLGDGPPVSIQVLSKANPNMLQGRPWRKCSSCACPAEHERRATWLLAGHPGAMSHRRYTNKGCACRSCKTCALLMLLETTCDI